MRVILEAGPFDVAPQALVDGLWRSVIEAGKEWGLVVEVVRTDSLGEAVARFNALVAQRDQVARENSDLQAKEPAYAARVEAAVKAARGE